LVPVSSGGRGDRVNGIGGTDRKGNEKKVLWYEKEKGPPTAQELRQKKACGHIQMRKKKLGCDSLCKKKKGGPWKHKKKNVQREKGLSFPKKGEQKSSNGKKKKHRRGIPSVTEKTHQLKKTAKHAAAERGGKEKVCVPHGVKARGKKKKTSRNRDEKISAQTLEAQTPSN